MTGCWEWTLYISERGYGKLYHKGRTHAAHKFFYEICFGPVPEGLELDHLCRNRWCCNPDHLEAVTHAENVRRGLAGKWQSTKTSCINGHEFTKQNTYRPEPTNRQPARRVCRQCNKEKVRRFRYRARVANTT